jgi:XTP/dITP diphosphohydrolase
MKELVFASSNAGKLAEVRAILEPQIKVLSLRDVEVLLGRAAPEVEETADTYTGNAKLKADEIFAWSRMPALADDSGLEVDALGGRPGLYSARYAGKDCSSEDNIKKVLHEMQGVKCRNARLVCYLYLKIDADQVYSSDAFIAGELLEAKRGSAGFGYDPLLWLPERGLTIAEAKAADKHFLSHRGQALRLLEKQLTHLFG